MRFDDVSGVVLAADSSCRAEVAPGWDVAGAVDGGYILAIATRPCERRPAAAADSLPPPTFNSGLPVAWTPTLELTVHIRANPAPGWQRLDTRTRCISHGRLEADCRLWDGDGQWWRCRAS